MGSMLGAPWEPDALVNVSTTIFELDASLAAGTPVFNTTYQSARAAAYRGMAPDAKLAFTDLSSGGTNDLRLTVPEDMEKYYRYAYDVDARVHSDSWGSGSVEYDQRAADVDAFAWAHQDFLPVFSAGNEGKALDSDTGGITTVASPATSKNAVAVGASLSNQGKAPGRSYKYSLHRLAVLAPAAGDNAEAPPTELEAFRIVQAAFGGQVSSLWGRRLGLAVAEPREACVPLDNGAAATKGAVVIVARGTCSSATKAANAQAAGAAAVLEYDDQISDFFVPAAGRGGAVDGVIIPAASIPRRVGQLLASSALAASGAAAATAAGPAAAASAASTPPGLTVSFGPAAEPAESYDSLAYFSSKGPTMDGRVKPDIVAPSTVSSAAPGTEGKPSCEARTMSGTSMATPLVAGAALLVRDYFGRGFYPAGAPDPARSHVPGAALVKAVLIAGGAELGGFEEDTGLPLGPPPSYRMGFGRVNLGASLPLAPAAFEGRLLPNASVPAVPAPFTLQVVDRAELRGGGSHAYCLHSTGGPLTVVLAWQDAPGSPAAGRALVNDLDLVVRGASLGGVPLLGNGGGKGGSPDRLNNVEAVTLARLPEGDVTIEVQGASVPRGPQPYALVVRGAFVGVLASRHNPAGTGKGAREGGCRVLSPSIRAGPEGAVATRDAAFEFGLADGGGRDGDGDGWQCALVAAADAAPGPAREFTPCTSPATYTNLTDGAYTFRVRAVSGDVRTAERSFNIDATGPLLAWNSSALPGGAAATGGDRNATPGAIAGLAWSAVDESPVLYTCRLDAVDGLATAAAVDGGQQRDVLLWKSAAAAFQAATAAGRPPMLVSPVSSRVRLGEGVPCASPAAYAWLLPGTWRVTVTAADVLGNPAGAALVHEWVVPGPAATREAGLPTVHITSGVLGPTTSFNIAFDLAVLRRSDDGGGGRDVLTPVSAEDSEEMECLLLPLAGGVLAGEPFNSTAQQPAVPPILADAPPGNWSRCGGAGSSRSHILLGDRGELRDGAYVFAARFKGAAGPGDGGGGGGGGGVPAQRLAEAKRGAAADGGGAPGPLTFSTFYVNTTGPVVKITAAPRAASPSPTAALNFTSAAEPPLLFWCKLEPAPDRDGARPTLRGTTRLARRVAATQPTHGPDRCSSPAAYTALPDGRYKFSVHAVSATAKEGGPAERFFRVNTMRPDIRGPVVPATVAGDSFQATFVVTDPSPGAGGALAAECRLRLLSSAGEVGRPSENGTWTPCASPTAFGPGLEEGRWGLTLRAANAAGNVRQTEEAVVYVDRSRPSGSIVAGPHRPTPAPHAVSFSFSADRDSAGAPVTTWECKLTTTPSSAKRRFRAKGPWKACTSPATYRGLKSGGYMFLVRPIDAAGNVGTVVARTFDVDASLPAVVAEPWAWTEWRPWAVVAAATAVLLGGGLFAARKAVGRALSASRRWTMRRASMAQRSTRMTSGRFSKQWSSLWSGRWAHEAPPGK